MNHGTETQQSWNRFPKFEGSSFFLLSLENADCDSGPSEALGAVHRLLGTKTVPIGSG